ncbi:MAG: DUF4430 domain-containing protein [Clostridiaceae bacterium]|nr:DUF4430 domain-containing protein [Clostridiaceae bacterium]
MKMTKFTKILSVLLCLALVVAIAVFATGCANKKTEEPATTAAPATTEAAVEEVTKLGQGEKEFTFIATDKDGKETKFSVSTDAATVGEALSQNGLIVIEENGFVNTVTGITLNWDTDKMYWAFYVDGAYAEKGVTETEVKAGSTYSFVATAG